MENTAPKQRAPRYSGGLTKLSTTRLDRRTNQEVVYTFWQASREVDPEHLPQGTKRKRITGNGQTPAIAKQRLELNYLKFISPENQSRPNMRGAKRITVAELFDEWIAYKAALDLSDTMVSKYKGYFRLHILPELGSSPVADLTELRLSMHFGNTLPGKQIENQDGTKGEQLLSGAAIRNIYMAFAGCLKYAVQVGYIRFSPLATVKKPKRHRPTDDFEQIAKDAKELLRRLEEDEHPDRARWAMQFLGLRKAERLGLTWSNVQNLDSDTPTMVISQQLARHTDGTGWYIKPKTKGGEPRRFVIPRQPFAELLRAHKERQDAEKKAAGQAWQPDEQFKDLVFLGKNGKLINPNQDNDDWNNLLAEYGFSPWRAHANRHITAVYLADMDPPVPIAYVRELLGHNSDAMAYYYTHLSQENLGQYLNKYGDKLANEIGRLRNPEKSGRKRF